MLFAMRRSGNTGGGIKATDSAVAKTYGKATPGTGTLDTGTPGTGTPGTGNPIAGNPIAGNPSPGTPGTGTPDKGTPGMGAPGVGISAEDAGMPPAFLETGEHRIYIKGYPDSTVRPDRSITRAEVAAIFFRLLQDMHRDGNAESTFRDVPFDAWFSQAVSTLAGLNIFPGYEDGSFHPNQAITRAEFIALAARLVAPKPLAGINGTGSIDGLESLSGKDSLDSIGGIELSDAHMTHQRGEYSRPAYAKEQNNGYEGGTIKSPQHITRAEAVRIVNTMLERLPAELPDILMNPYIDITETHWALTHIMEASVEHTYKRGDDGAEFWTTHICPITGELLIHVDDHELLPPWLQ